MCGTVHALVDVCVRLMSAVLCEGAQVQEVVRSEACPVQSKESSNCSGYDKHQTIDLWQLLTSNIGKSCRRCCFFAHGVW